MNYNEIKKIALIDADSLIYYCSLGNKEYPTKLEEAISDIDNRIYEMVKQSGATHYITFVSKSTNNFRFNIAKSAPYKGNRKKTDMPPVFIGLKAYLYQKPSFICNDFEADDGVGLFKTYFNNLGIETIICSPDKDVLEQIPGVHYNYGKNEVVSTTEEQAERFLYLQVLMGDSTDNIPGIPKVGVITANKYLDENPDNHLLVCLNKYIEKFGKPLGLNKFTETFRLVYILQSEEDLIYNCGLTFADITQNLTDTIISNSVVWEEE